MHEKRLSALDTAFLCLESAQAPMHLGALAVFGADHAGPADHLVEIVSERVGRLPCLRQRVRPAWLPPGSAVWVDDAVFDLKHHIHLHDLDGGG
ncbi:MAG: diacylglycerol O-acyltransferase / wax synthase, partial [Micromonosporaceae bacterium]|nr:diacylglycerol O-acyltransferase / wax synthase [Micromonosporaceae bacterium]